MTDQTSPNAFRPKDICRRNSIGLTTFYALIAAGELKARKIGRATVVLAEDEKAWLESLPLKAA